MRRGISAALAVALLVFPCAAEPDPPEVPITGPEGPNAALRERPFSVPDDAALVRFPDG